MKRVREKKGVRMKEKLVQGAELQRKCLGEGRGTQLPGSGTLLSYSSDPR